MNRARKKWEHSDEDSVSVRNWRLIVIIVRRNSCEWNFRQDDELTTCEREQIGKKTSHDSSSWRNSQSATLDDQQSTTEIEFLIFHLLSLFSRHHLISWLKSLYAICVLEESIPDDDEVDGKHTQNTQKGEREWDLIRLTRSHTNFLCLSGRVPRRKRFFRVVFPLSLLLSQCDSCLYDDERIKKKKV